MNNKLTKFVYAWMLVACMCGCTRNGCITNGVSMPEAIPLTAETVVTEVDALLPRAMFVYDGKLGIYKEREEFMLDFYTLPDFNFVCSTTRRGQGPDDLIGLECRNIEVLDTTFSALEHMTWRIKTMTLVGDSAMHVVGVSKPLETSGAINMFLRLDSLHYLSLGSTTNQKEFCIYDLSDGSAHEVGEYPEWIDDASTVANGMPLQFPYGKFLAVSPDGKKFAAFYWHFDRVRFFDSDCRLLNDVEVSRKSKVDKEDDINRLPSCYYGVMTAGDKIYALHADTDSTRTLEVWNWDGRPISAFRLDRPVTVMTVDTALRRLITKDAEHSNEIYLYELDADS